MEKKLELCLFGKLRQEKSIPAGREKNREEGTVQMPMETNFSQNKVQEGGTLKAYPHPAEFRVKKISAWTNRS